MYLTWSGWEFVDNAKNDTRWNEVKKFIGERAAGLSLQVLNATLRHYAEEALGFPV